MGRLLPSAFACMLLVRLVACGHGDWPGFGGASPEHNQRRAPEPSAIGASNVHKLKVQFVVNTSQADVSATPAISNGVMYFPDWNGYMWAVNANTGALMWKVFLRDALPEATHSNATLVARTSAAVHPDQGLVIIGTQTAEPAIGGTYAFVLALHTADGTVAWKFNASYHPYAVITASATIWQDAVYIGVSSREEDASGLIPNYPCCTFIGSLYKLRLCDGQLMWQTFFAPDNGGKLGGFAGSSVWGSAPAIDAERSLVYIATGNNYIVPQAVLDCINSTSDLSKKAKCQHVPGNWYDSVLALDIATGAIIWGNRLSGLDVYTDSCVPGGFYPYGVCHVPESKDSDFAQAPIYIPGVKCSCGKSSKVLDIIVAAQKSGMVYGFNAHVKIGGNSADMLWMSDTGTGSVLGGSQWGSASDGYSTVFLQNTNFYKVPVNMTRPAPGSSHVAQGGFFTAIDICTGHIKWQAAAANKALASAPPMYTGAGNNGVVLFPTLSPDGVMYALRASDGRMMASFATGASVLCGPSAAHGLVYVGTGYKSFLGTHGTKVVAYSLAKA